LGFRLTLLIRDILVYDIQMLASSNKSGAMAGVLVSFLPVLDKLGMLQAQHGEDEFGKSYNALQGVMRQVYIDLGTTEYTVNAGDAVDKMRVDVIEAEHSDQPADTVIRPLSMGLEIDGNVIRAAQCIASLGPVVAEDAVEEMEGGEESAGSSE
jgi:molecular chaperone GrpE (heat shock protein)